MIDIIFFVLEGILGFILCFSMYMVVVSGMELVHFQKACTAMHKYAIMCFI